MLLTGKRRRFDSVDVWPGFVDAMATILMVIIFVLMTFIISQLYLTNVLSNKDNELCSLNEAIINLKEDVKKLEDKNQKFTLTIANLQEILSSTKQELGKEKDDKKVVIDENTSLTEQIKQLKHEIEKLNENLESQEITLEEKTKAMDDLDQKLNKSLSEKIEELNRLNEELDKFKVENKKLDKNSKINQYRSEFFAQLKEVLGDRNDVRVVGDRFIFQSEVLFAIGSSELGEDGKKQLDQLVKVLKEITPNIPKDFKWILRVDGHTDKLPIKSSKFPSNWELSSARAIAVVQYLISQGIDPFHLVAAGFGEYQPLSVKEDDIAKNRRIEFKLDQR
jgi:chemotaxis protein MotB